MSLRSWVYLLVVSISFALLAGRLFRLTDRYAVSIFFWDQWAINDATLFQKHTLWEMFRWQYGPHRLGLGPLVAKMISPLFHWNSRAESFIAVTIVVVSGGCGLWLKKRLFGDISASDAAIPIIYFSARQYESLFINTDLAHGPLPLLLITLYGLAWTVHNVSVRYALVVLLNFVTLYTGFGLFLGLLTPWLLVFDYRRNRGMRSGMSVQFAAVLILACASLVSFFIGYKQQAVAAVSCFPNGRGKLTEYFWYMTMMFAKFFGVSSIGWIGKLAGTLVICWLACSLFFAIRSLLAPASPSWQRSAVSATLVSYTLLFSLSAAVGRLCLGLDSAHASRYTNYIALGIFGAYLQMLCITTPTIKRSALGVVMVAVMATIPIRAEDRGLMRFFSGVKQTWRTCYLAGHNISECDNSAEYKIEPEPEQVLQQKLQYLKEKHLNLFSD